MIKGKNIIDNPITTQSSNNKPKAPDFTAFTSFSGTNSLSNTTRWIIDTSATSHICSDDSLYYELNKEKQLHNVVLPDDSQQPVTHTSKIKLSPI